MRAVATMGLCAALMILTGCSAEPDFDQKFDERSRELNARAQKIEVEAQAQLAAAREAEQATAERSRSQRAAAQ